MEKLHRAQFAQVSSFQQLGALNSSKTGLAPFFGMLFPLGSNPIFFSFASFAFILKKKPNAK